MATANSQTMALRRPALIPPDLHLSPEDEQSILLRIGNLQLDSLGSQPSSSSRHGSSHDNCSTIPASDYAPQILPAARDKLANAMPGTKRKASTTAEQHRELSYSGEEN